MDFRTKRRVISPCPTDKNLIPDEFKQISVLIQMKNDNKNDDTIRFNTEAFHNFFSYWKRGGARVRGRGFPEWLVVFDETQSKLLELRTLFLHNKPLANRGLVKKI